ncbi:VOC family protein [Lacibacter sp. H375]|uniref:VOC family protein n=1 Tax=Lacibacter sp. H375 TaxID=3133424 RepID=UPI0030BBCB0A
MNLNKLSPLLYTSQLKDTVDWYVHVLGFTCTDFVPVHGFARVQLHAVDIMLALPNAHIPFEQPQFTGSFYINTNSVDYWWEKLKDTCKVCYPIENFDYGMREFAVYDINGYLLQFGQPVFNSNTNT